MNQPDVLTHLFRHHLWANLRLLDRCRTLTEAQLGATQPGMYGTIRETIQHIVRAEQTYFSRISTGEPPIRPASPPPMTFAEMEASLQRTGAGLIEWAKKVQPEDFVWMNWDGEQRKVPTTVIVTQTINHANEHREQIKGMMTVLGIEPPDLQSWAYHEDIWRSSGG